jgi:bud site selection protein 20
MGSIRRSKTKRRTRDLDQVKADLKSPKHLSQHKGSKAAEDLPALGEFYCVECAKYFSDSHNLNEHRRGKIHKRRVRMLKEEAHSQKLADAAVGLGTDNGRIQQSQNDLNTEAMEDV